MRTCTWLCFLGFPCGSMAGDGTRLGLGEVKDQTIEDIMRDAQTRQQYTLK